MSSTLYQNLALHGSIELPKMIGPNKWIRQTMYDQKYWNALFSANMVFAFVCISFLILSILSHSHCISACGLEEHLGGSALIWNAVAGCMVSGALIYFVYKRMIVDESFLYFHSKKVVDWTPEDYLKTSDLPVDFNDVYRLAA